MARRTKKQKKKKMQIGLLLLLILMIASLFIMRLTDVGKETIAPIQVYEHEVEMEKGVDLLIRDYFITTYSALATLEIKSLKNHYLLENADAELSYALDQASLDYLVESRQLSGVDLSLVDYTCGITYHMVSANEEGNTVVSLMEDQRLRFAISPHVDSLATGILHTFVLAQNGSTYKILEHTKNDEAYTIIRDAYDVIAEVGQDKLATVSQVKTELLNEAKTNLATLTSRKSQVFSEEKTSEEAEKGYHRINAIEYSKTWVSSPEVLRNAKWADYGDGDAQNFISQCLIAGGIHMDVEGQSIWKYYWNEQNNSSDREGYSDSWTNISDFYTYAKENYGDGLLSATGKNNYLGQEGDIIQFGAKGEWRHTGIIVEVIKNEFGDVVDFLINAHAMDKKNYPSLAHPYTNQRLIQILGYND